MHFQAQTVPQAVAELIRIASLRNDLPGHRVKLAPGDPRTRRLNRRLLGIVHRRVDLNEPLIRFQRRDRPGDVRAVTVQLSAAVDLDHIPGRQLPLPRHCVGECSGGTEGADGAEGHGVGTRKARRPLQFQRHLPLGDADLNRRQHRCERLVHDRRGSPDTIDLRRLLDRPQLLNHLARGDEFRVRQLALEALESGVEGAVRFESHPARLRRLQILSRPRKMTIRRQRHLDPPWQRGGVQFIPAIRTHQGIPAHYSEAFSCEPEQITQVRLAGDQQCIHAVGVQPVPQLPATLRVIHKRDQASCSMMAWAARRAKT